MPIQLDKILADIAEEKALHPQSDAAKSKKDQDEAWIKVGKKNKLSAHEAKSIFKVLLKKYEQEKLKPSSTWKLFHLMEDICRKQEDIKPKLEEENQEPEEESMVEFLEVREEDDEYEVESDNQDKTMRSNSPTASSPEKETPSNAADTKSEQKVLNSNMLLAQASTHIKPEIAQLYEQQQQQKQQQQKQSAIKTLQSKGISLRKTIPGPILRQNNLNLIKTSTPDTNRTIMMSESVKRKLQSMDSQRDSESTPSKKMNTTIPLLPLVQIPDTEIKKEITDEMETVTSNTGINVITIPPSVQGELSNGVTGIKSNGFNTQLEGLDFQKDLIFENNPTSTVKAASSNATPGEIINIGNFDNQLPPTFFKNLCNSNRHEALGLYVANVMNRVSTNTAAKLELNILKAIVEAQSDEIARL